MADSERLVLFRRARNVARAGLQGFARLLREQVVEGREFRCLVTDDRELCRLNRLFLGKDYPTDVLSFPVVEQVPNERPLPHGRGSVMIADTEPRASASGLSTERVFLGEMAISAERAAVQARQYGHDAADEIRILMLHGLLHLAGMDHETDRGRMRRAESVWRRKLGLPAALIERVRS